jgi:pyruvate/2-oxoglutarate dehydrogenase complex dihydrolipoamide dehydrogenase (E3) component
MTNPHPSSDHACDVVVVGLGPGGEATANKLASEGLEVVAVERHLVGGECPYYGCVPSKMMIRAADVLAEARRVSGLAGESTVTPSWAPVADRIRAEATDGWDDAVAVRRLEDAGARLVRGHGRLAGTRRVEVDGRVYAARRAIVLNPGTAPGTPPIDGLEGTPYWTNREVVSVTDLPGSLVVLGGGPIGCELTQAFARFGVRVTLVEAAPRIMAPEEPETSRVVTGALERDGVRVLVDVRVRSVSYADGTFSLDLGGEVVTADKLLVAAGRVPQLADLGLDSVGLDPQARALDVDSRMRVLDSGRPIGWLYAVGDVTGKGAFTHVSMYGAGAAVHDILGEGRAYADFEAVPRVTFTDPEVGSVGLTEERARRAGMSVRTGTAALPETTRGWLHARGNEGLVKLVAADGRLVGATSVGPAGGEVLSMLTLAVHARVPLSTLRSMIFAYPTFHGAVKDALTALG